MKWRSFPFLLLIILILTCVILQSNALAYPSPFIVSSSGMANYNVPSSRMVNYNVPSSRMVNYNVSLSRMVNYIVSSSRMVNYNVSSSGMINYNPTPNDGWLHTDGRYIKDSQGRIVALRTLSITWKKVVPSENSYAESFVDAVKAHGINNIMLSWNHWDMGESYSFVFPNDLPKLDEAIALIKSKGLYASLSFLQPSTQAIQNGWATSHLDVIPINEWTMLLTRYANESAVCMARLIDEPNFYADEERQMYYNAIDALKPINPNMIWNTHCITNLRVGTAQYWYLNPWQEASQVPDNVYQTAGWWVRTPSVGYGEIQIETNDYASADQWLQTMKTRIDYWIAHAPSNLAIGLVGGSSGGSYPPENAHHYLLREVYRYQQQNHLYIMPFFPSWQTKIAEETISLWLPDTPYEFYWD